MDYGFEDNFTLLFNQGKSTNAFEYLGCHSISANGGLYRFAVWAPNASYVSVVGDFNGWNPETNPMQPQCEGIWLAHIEKLSIGQLYKYAIRGADGALHYKADPFAFRSELRPGTASMIWPLEGYRWKYQNFSHKVNMANPVQMPMNIYEVHLGSWKYGLSYKELAEQLPAYAKDMGYTHIELMPLSEYPLDMSWGYQVSGYYSVTSRYGTPQEFMYFIDKCHECGLGVIMDWVPAHFPRDEHGLCLFDGTPLFEHPDPRRSEQKQWGTLQFNFERNEVNSFLISNAVFWFKLYHIDGIRVDAVSCMLYLDYGKEPGQWLPNKLGGRENLSAIEFFGSLSHTLNEQFMSPLLIAEESSAFPLVSRPPYDGGLGFNFKWDMGFMNDTLEYMQMDSIFRKWHHRKLTFSMYYTFSENYILPFSHDEAVHGKKSLLDKMPGDYWQKFAQLRLLYSYTFAHPGKKLLFMGGEFGQFIEWKFDQSLDWFLLEYEMHEKMRVFTRTLNHFYTGTEALWELDDGWQGFEWLNVSDEAHSLLAFARFAKKSAALVCIFNFTPQPWINYRLGVPGAGRYTEALNNDEVKFGGTGEWSNGTVTAQNIPWNGKSHSIEIRIPPFGAVFFSYEADKPADYVAAEEFAFWEPGIVHDQNLISV